MVNLSQAELVILTESVSLKSIYSCCQDWIASFESSFTWIFKHMIFV